ncbi:hypothetical protein A4D02_35745 [Niastella koreensis]|uniref:Uncharacterized protein n=1 Tax=Niastella koreensis TaxID=354356 RepID=A0ABX3NTM1_9BACT|nr:hypothetical protein A4D02_35745 [Niastella koreensis]
MNSWTLEQEKPLQIQRFEGVSILFAEREGIEPNLLLIVSQLVECCKMGDSMDDACNIQQL